MNPNESEAHFRQYISQKNYSAAALELEKILAIPDQPWQRYLYLPASFYEEWGDYAAARSPDLARNCYQHALRYRLEIGYQATGSGEGMEAMYHVKRLRKKLEK